MKTLAVASGKGGVGKTNISANIAVTLAEYQHSVLLVDADLGLGNVDILLGLKPQSTLKHVVTDDVALKDTIVAGPAGIDVVGAVHTTATGKGADAATPGAGCSVLRTVDQAAYPIAQRPRTGILRAVVRRICIPVLRRRGPLFGNDD